jgi:CRISPR-associated protein Csm1
MTDETIYKIAIAAFMHDVGKFAERASVAERQWDDIDAGFYLDEQFLTNNMDLYQPHYNNVYTHKHAVYTAGFIDRIEEFLPREFNKGDWGLNDSFVNLAAGHHKPETPLQWVIAIADRVSSGFDRDEFENYNKGIGYKDYKKTRLLTIFEGVSPDGIFRDDNLESYRFRYPLKELSPENIFPVGAPPLEKGGEGGFEEDNQASNDYSNLFFNFISSLGGLIHKQYIPLWFEHFDSLFMIYTSHIPAATVGKVVPDISLYDHSKTTAALASAIYLYHKQNGTMEIEKVKDYSENKFLIVTGDFYGIQNFIFSEGGSTNKASAKLLRGRSFAVSLISELAADMLCREIGLTPVSIILNAAGKFTIIAPNTDETKSIIRVVEEKINEWFIKNYYGESAIGISYIESSCSDFTTKGERFTKLWDRLARMSERRKYSKINLEGHGGVVNGYLDRFNNDLNKKLCPFCGKRPSSIDGGADPYVSEGESACNICRDHIYIGTNLVKASRIAITTVDADIHGEKLKESLFGEYQVSLDVTGNLSELAASRTLLKYWDISIPKKTGVTKNISSKFINGYVATYDESDLYEDRYLAGRKSEQKKLELIEQIKVDKDNQVPKTFLHLAKKALNSTDISGKFTGIEALGILKVDVDNLGFIFACGLKSFSLSRLATLSRQMNNYFAIYLPYLLSSKDEFRDIYTIFAGGDDLFLIGPWNRMIDFAVLLNNKFREYVCGNSSITISAGISINKPGEPVLAISDSAENALKKSKNNNRNSITVFDEVIKWDEFKELSEIKNSIQGWLEKGFINNAMLFRLNSFSHLSGQERELTNLLDAGNRIGLDEMECLKWGATFKYNLVRNIGKNLRGDERAEAVREVERAADWLKRYGGAMKIPVWQIIYNRR